MKSELAQLRSRAVAQTFFRPTHLRMAIERLGFVQADPIRAPARAQDLILRHRVKGYRDGDLERRYHTLDLEEDLFYAYGFVTRPAWRFLRTIRPGPFSKLEKLVLAKVRELGRAHPRDLDVHFGRQQVRNDWGGFSQATKRALERLHNQSVLRVARREKGIRVYEPVAPCEVLLTPDERLHANLIRLATTLGPIRAKLLQWMGGRMRAPQATDHRLMIKRMIQDGELEQLVVDGVVYLWPAAVRHPPNHAPETVRFLAPFDPLIWDRERFAHLWRWDYRFEAYTSPARRIRGYYAMPLLWGENVIGWANANVADGKLRAELGFVGARPTARSFAREADAEIARLTAFLGL